MNNYSTWRQLPWLATIIVILAACGGGGSSSGGGSSGSTETEGVFVGTFSITIESSSERVNDGGTMTLLVKNNLITRDPGTDATSGSVDGTSFAIVNSASTFLNTNGVSCSGRIQQVGKIAPGRINGNIFSSNVSCNGIPFSVSGTFRADFDRAAL
jgi:hypothetical protein